MYPRFSTNSFRYSRCSSMPVMQSSLIICPAGSTAATVALRRRLRARPREPSCALQTMAGGYDRRRDRILGVADEFDPLRQENEPGRFGFGDNYLRGLHASARGNAAYGYSVTITA